MTQDNTDPKERGTVNLSAPTLAVIVIAVAAIAVALTVALTPRPSTSTTAPVAAQPAPTSEIEVISVPNVCGLERAHATQTITNARLDVGTLTEDYADDVPAGSVISQRPDAGTLANPDSRVDLVISRGRKAPTEVSMPSIVGMTREDAERTLRNAKLVAVQAADVVSGDVTPGLVCTQSIAAGTRVAQDTYVSYAIALAPDTSIVVPNLAGEPLADARGQLANAGLGIDTSYAYSDTVEADRVIAQSVAAGSKVARGTTVTLAVSMGRRPQGPHEVPDVTGKATAQALDALKGAGLAVTVVNEYSDRVARDTVIAQSIAAKTKVAKDTLITVTISMGARADGFVTVPDLAGKTADEAESALGEAGLSCERAAAYSDQVAEGRVIGQSIASGSKVAKGTVVSLTVSAGTKPATPAPAPTKVSVPDVMTYTLDDAVAAIKSCGLVERVTGEEAGTVVSQDLAAGTEVEEGTVVTIKLEHISSKVTVPDVSGLTAADAAAKLSLAGLTLAYDEGRADSTLEGTDPVAGALLDQGAQVRPVYRESSAPDAESRANDTDDGRETADGKAEADGTSDDAKEQDPAEDKSGTEPAPAGDKAAADATASDGDKGDGERKGDDKAMLEAALKDAGVKYELVKTVKTQPANDGCDYTLECRDETGTYIVVIHVPGTAGAKASLVSVTSSTEG